MGVDVLSDADPDCCDGSIDVASDAVLHLHRFKDDESVTSSNVIADGNQYCSDGAGHRSLWPTSAAFVLAVGKARNYLNARTPQPVVTVDVTINGAHPNASTKAVDRYVCRAEYFGAHQCSDGLVINELVT